MTLRLLIDGYNLLHATGAISQGRGPGRLAKARQRMLGQIAAELTEEERRATQVVFDTQRSIDDEPATSVRGMRVTYAVGFAEADDLIEQLIRQHPQPRTLTVVSSDVRVQRCAKSRKARAVGSDQWLMELLDGHERTEPTASASPGEVAESAAHADSLGRNEIDTDREKRLSNDEVQAWLKEFGLDHDL